MKCNKSESFDLLVRAWIEMIYRGNYIIQFRNMLANLFRNNFPKCILCFIKNKGLLFRLNVNEWA